MKEEKPNALVVGGSSGLGLELGLLLDSTSNVIVTGRRDPKKESVTFFALDLNAKSQFTDDIEKFVARLPQIDLLIYTAGFYQEGSISDVSDKDIANMVNVGLIAPAMLLQRLLKKQAKLSGFIAVTSTSQWTPRFLEPVYTAVKAGLGILSNSVSLDERIGKVLVAGPAGMNTRFWENNPRDKSTMLDPTWVAEKILDNYFGDFKYKFIHVLRGPARVQTIEIR